jgi:alpha-beta hydrolase superfamily lysophospholipase
MHHREGYVKGVRDADIYYQAWLPDGEVRAALLIVHGLGEHSGRYMNVVDHLVPLGYAAYALDHVGHGKSEGEREVVARFSDYIDTLATFHGMVRDGHPAAPLFLLGHSMGGLIVTTYLLDHASEVAGAVISAPAIKAGDVSQATVLLGKLLSTLAPKAGVLALDANQISRDPDVVAAYVDDPLVFHGKTPARLAAEMMKAMERVDAEAARITTPFIVVQGSEDKLVDPGGARMLYERAGSQDKTLKLYEGLYHEVFNEPERERVLQDVETWLAARV